MSKLSVLHQNLAFSEKRSVMRCYRFLLEIEVVKFLGAFLGTEENPCPINSLTLSRTTCKTNPLILLI